MSARPHLYAEALNLKFVNWLQLRAEQGKASEFNK